MILPPLCIPHFQSDNLPDLITEQPNTPQHAQGRKQMDFINLKGSSDKKVNPICIAIFFTLLQRLTLIITLIM